MRLPVDALRGTTKGYVEPAGRRLVSWQSHLCSPHSVRRRIAFVEFSSEKATRASGVTSSTSLNGWKLQVSIVAATRSHFHRASHAIVRAPYPRCDSRHGGLWNTRGMRLLVSRATVARPPLAEQVKLDQRHAGDLRPYARLPHGRGAAIDGLQQLPLTPPTPAAMRTTLSVMAIHPSTTLARPPPRLKPLRVVRVRW